MLLFYTVYQTKEEITLVLKIYPYKRALILTEISTALPAALKLLGSKVCVSKKTLYDECHAPGSIPQHKVKKGACYAWGPIDISSSVHLNVCKFRDKDVHSMWGTYTVPLRYQRPI